MPPKSLRPTESSHTNRGGLRRHVRLALLVLCASLVFNLPSETVRAQEPQPQPTPYVRPRRTAEPPPTPEPQTQPVPTAQPQPVPTPAETSEEVDEDEVVRVDSNLVIIPATVVDAFGRAVTDLKVNDFELKIDGEVRNIGELTRSETPVHVALLFDNSYSLSAAREFEKQAAVRFFQRVVRPIDRAAVYSISTTPTLSQGLTNDVSRLVRTIERFGAPDGATALFDAIAQAADYMRPLTGRKVLVLVSDGTDTVSDTNFDEAINRALRAECQVYVVQTRQVEDPNLHDPISEQRMFRLTEQTGGAVYVPKSVEELDGVFTQISLDLSQQYLLSYYPQDERKDKYFRFINLRVKTRPTARVRARKGFYPDGAQSNATLSTVPQPRAAEAAPSHKRATTEPAPARTAPPAPTRGRRGPDGPDTEEEARQSALVAESMPTFTVTVSAPTPSAQSTAVPAPAAEPSTPPAPERVIDRSPAEAAVNDKPVETANASATQPKPANDPAPPAAESQPAEESKPNGEAPGAPLSAGVLNSKALRLPVPAYPSVAKNNGAQGRVVIEVTIDEEGKVIDARPVSGHTFLLQAAMQAARQARFRPALLSGQPVKVKGLINYVFTLP